MIKEIIRTILNSSFFDFVSKIIQKHSKADGTIIMFHRVLNEEEITSPDIEVSIEYFEELIQYFINEGYIFISLDDIYRKKIPKKKFLIITFDDGYYDNYTNAYPILKKYNIPFTIYISTSFPNYTSILWWYGIKEIIEKNDELQFELNKKRYLYDIKRDKIKCLTIIRRKVLDLDSVNRKIFLDNLFEKYNINISELTKREVMSWEQIVELSKDPLVTIGAHTVNHVNLKQCTDEELKYELRKSKDLIEDKIGKEVKHFAYPFGSPKEVGKREMIAVEEIGYKTSVSTIPGNVKITDDLNSFLLPRISPGPAAESSNPRMYTSGIIPFMKKMVTKK